MATSNRRQGRFGVAGDVNPDDERIHPVDPDGDPAGLATDDTRDTEADPTPNTMAAAEANPESGIRDEANFTIKEPPAIRRPGRGADPKIKAAQEYLRAHPGVFVVVGSYPKPSAVPAKLKVIDDRRVEARWAKEQDEEGNESDRFELYLKLTDQPYVKRPRKTAPNTGAETDGSAPHPDTGESEDATPAEQSNAAKNANQEGESF